MSTSVPPPNMPQPEPVPFELPRPPRRIPGRVKALGGVAALVVVVVLAVVAFGGGSGGGPLGPVAQAATVSTGAPGFAMHMTMAMNSAGSSGQVFMTANGVIDERDHAGSMTMSMDFGNDPRVTAALHGGHTVNMKEIIRGTTIYVGIPGLAAGIPQLGGKRWISVDLAKVNGFGALGSELSSPSSSNPAEMLQSLRAVSSGVNVVGHDSIRGVPTTEYSAAIDLDRIANAVPPADRAAVQSMLSTLGQQASISQIPVNVWVDAQHLVRRMKMSIATSASGAALNMDMTIDMTHYGPEPDPGAPPADQVMDLSSMMNGLSGTSSGGPVFGG